MALFISLFLAVAAAFSFALLIYWIDRYEKEPIRLLVGVFFWGAFIAGGGAFLLNTTFGIGFYLVTNNAGLTDLVSGSVVAPIVEESLKGLAVLLIFLFFRQEFDSLLDGLVYAGITALGFAAVENAYYIYNYGWLDSGWEGIFLLAFIRIILVGWQHPFYTAFTGLGLAFSRLSRQGVLRFLSIPAGYALAVLTHSLHNTLAYFLTGVGGLVLGSLIDWAQLFLMLGFIFWLIRQESKRMERYLRPYLDSGLLTAHQYRVACSPFRQIDTRFKALLRGRYHIINRFYQVCAELAQKRYQLESFGNEKGNQQAIAQYETELSQLAEALRS